MKSKEIYQTFILFLAICNDFPETYALRVANLLPKQHIKGKEKPNYKAKK